MTTTTGNWRIEEEEEEEEGRFSKGRKENFSKRQRDGSE